MKNLPYRALSTRVTAFKDDGSLCERGTRKYIRFLLEGGVHGLAPMGSAGEFFAMTEEERMQVTEWILDEVDGKIPVFAYTGRPAGPSDICRRSLPSMVLVHGGCGRAYLEWVLKWRARHGSVPSRSRRYAR